MLFHLDGSVPDVEGAGGEELVHGESELLAGGVVDVGFEEDDVVLPAGEGCVGVWRGRWVVRGLVAVGFQGGGADGFEGWW